MMKRIVLIFVIWGSLISPSAAQNSDWLFGGTATVDFGTFQDRVMLSPYLGKQIFPKCYFGGNATLAYLTNETVYFQTTDNVTTEVSLKDQIWYYGGGLFIQYLPFEQKEYFIRHFFLQSRYEYLWGRGTYREEARKYNYQTDNQTIFLDIGYKQSLSARLKLHLLLSFKLNQESDSPYRNPMIRFGVEF